MTEGEIGIRIRGGKEYGIGIFVAHVAENSAAAAAGLVVGLAPPRDSLKLKEVLISGRRSDLRLQWY